MVLKKLKRKKIHFDKRGISAVISSIMIILIVVGGTTLVWKIITPTINERIHLSDACKNADLMLNVIGGYTCYDPVLNGISVQVKKGRQEVNISGVEFIVQSQGNSVRIKKDLIFNNNEIKTFYFNVSSLGLSNIEKISISPIVMFGEKEKKCDITSFVKIPSSDCDLSAKNLENLTISSEGGYIAGGGGGSSSCIPQCDGKFCGDDGCEGSCGECEASSICSSGICVPIPTINVISYQKINSASIGNSLISVDSFGRSITFLGDLNGDNITDLAVGKIGDDDGASNAGAVYILFMNSNGTVQNYQKINSASIGNSLNANDYFGSSITPIGDINNDGVIDLAVGAYGDDDGASNAGAVYILFMNSNGTVQNYQKINSASIGNSLNAGDHFGQSITPIGDINNDGVIDLAVGANRDDDGASNAGAVYILFMNSNGTVQNYQKINSSDVGNSLDVEDFFGCSIDYIQDFDNNGVGDLVVGANEDDDGASNAGAVYILYLE